MCNLRSNIVNIVSAGIELGKEGEKLASDFLHALGWHVLSRNWRYQRTDLDIIAMDGDILVFIEVKTRRGEKWGAPELAVNTAKQNRMLHAASAYASTREHEGEIRFDIIAICWPVGGSPILEHFEDVFFPME
jgi:putative endonuclease